MDEYRFGLPTEERLLPLKQIDKIYEIDHDDSVTSTFKTIMKEWNEWRAGEKVIRECLLWLSPEDVLLFYISKKPDNKKIVYIVGFLENLSFPFAEVEPPYSLYDWMGFLNDPDYVKRVADYEYELKEAVKDATGVCQEQILWASK